MHRHSPVYASRRRAAPAFRLLIFTVFWSEVSRCSPLNLMLVMKSLAIELEKLKWARLITKLLLVMLKEIRNLLRFVSMEKQNKLLILWMNLLKC